MILRDEARCVGDFDLVRQAVLDFVPCEVSPSDFFKLILSEMGIIRVWKAANIVHVCCAPTV